MVTLDPTTSLTRILIWKAGKALDRRARNQEASTRTRTLYQATIRLLLHLSGFACLTIAGFAFSFIAGMVIAGVCCFVMSTLLTSDDGGTK